MSDEQTKLSLIKAPQVERVLALFREHEAAGGVGTILWTRLSDMTGLPYPSTKLYQVVKRAGKKFWRETDKWIRTDRGNGVYICSGEEQLNEARGTSIRAIRDVSLAYKVAETIADDRLDDVGRKKRDHFNMRMRQMETFVKAESKAITSEFKAYESLPRPQDVQDRKIG